MTAREELSTRVILRNVLESLDHSAWVVQEDGAILLTNFAAKREATTTPAWVLRLAQGERCEAAPERARARILGLDGARVILVLGPSTDVEEEALRELGLCDPHLEVAEHLVRGFSDREIALVMGRPLASIHASILHVHRELGVHTRTELVALVRRTRRTSAVTRSPRAREVMATVPARALALTERLFRTKP